MTAGGDHDGFANRLEFGESADYKMECPKTVRDRFVGGALFVY